MENKSLSYEEVQQEIGKRNYQKILLAILTGLITFIIFIIEIFIMKVLPNCLLEKVHGQLCG